MEKWEEIAQTPIRLRVINIFKYWLQHECSDFLENEKLRKNFLRFLKEDVSQKTRGKSSGFRF